MSSPGAAPKIEWPTFWIVMASCFLATITAQLLGLLGNDINPAMGVQRIGGLWLTSTYIAVQVISIPLAANLAGPLGLWRVMTGAAIFYALFSILSFFIHDYTAAILLRIGIALSAGAFLPLGILIVFRTFGPTNPKLIPFGLTVFAVMASLPAALSPLIGSTIAGTQAVNIYMILAACGAIVALASFLFMPRDPLVKEGMNIDWFGALLIGAWAIPFAAMMYHGERLNWWEHDMIKGLTLVCIAMFAIQVTYHLNHAKPLIDIRLLFERPNFGWAVMAFVFFRLGLLALSSVYPQFLAQIQGFRIEQTGPTLAWALLPMLIGFPLAFYISCLLDPKYLLAAGLSLFGLAALYNIQLSSLWSAEQFHTALILIGFGQPLFMVGLLLIATTGVGPPQGPSAGTLINIGRVIGQSVGVAWIGTMLSKRTDYHYSILSDAASQGTVNIGDAQGNIGQYLAVINRDSLILSYNDVFLLIGVSLLFVALAVLILLPPKKLYTPPPPPQAVH